MADDRAPRRRDRADDGLRRRDGAGPCGRRPEIVEPNPAGGPGSRRQTRRHPTGLRRTPCRERNRTGNCSTSRSTASGWPTSTKARATRSCSSTAIRRRPICGATSCRTSKGSGRLVACDLIGMGDSDKLDDSGPDRYHYAEQRDYLFALWDALELGDRVDTRSARLGFGARLRLGQPAPRPRRRHRLHGGDRRCRSTWADLPEPVRDVFQGFRSAGGRGDGVGAEHLRRARAARLDPAQAHRRGDGPTTADRSATPARTAGRR